MKTGRGFDAWTPESAAAHVEAVERHLIRLLQYDRASGRAPLPGGSDDARDALAEALSADDGGRP